MFIRKHWEVYGNTVELTRFRNNGDIIHFLANNDNSILFKFKEKITGQTKSDGTNDVEIIVLLKRT